MPISESYAFALALAVGAWYLPWHEKLPVNLVITSLEVRGCAGRLGHSALARVSKASFGYVRLGGLQRLRHENHSTMHAIVTAHDLWFASESALARA